VHVFSVVLGEPRAGVALRDRAEFDIDLGLGGVVGHLVLVCFFVMHKGLNRVCGVCIYLLAFTEHKNRWTTTHTDTPLESHFISGVSVCVMCHPHFIRTFLIFD
jgi:hypothetical protein